jgi:hypothetical protein
MRRSGSSRSTDRFRRLHTRRSALIGVSVIALLLQSAACGDPEPPPVVAVPMDPVPISGLYDVKGVTRAVEGPGDERRIAGTVILRQEGDAYTATFKLDTTFPGINEPVQADVIGSGEGIVEGRTLRGSAETQLVVSTVPGIDTDFAFIPRIVGARVSSTVVTKIEPDGSLVIELENQPAEGEHDYLPTRTRLTGRRVADSSSAARPKHQPARE